MNDGQQIRLRRDQSPLVKAAPLDQPVDRRRNQRVVQIELRLDEFGSRGLKLRPRGKLLRHRVIDVFLAYGLLRQQRPDAGKILRCLDQSRFRLRDLGLRGGRRRLKRHRIDLIEPVALFHIAPLSIEDRFQNAGHLRSNLDRSRRLRLADEFRLVRNGLRRDRDDLDLRNILRRHRAGFLFATGRKHQQTPDQNDNNGCGRYVHGCHSFNFPTDGDRSVYPFGFFVLYCATTDRG